MRVASSCLRCVMVVAAVACAWPRLAQGGDPLWTANGLAVCAAAGAQSNPHILPDGTGGVFIAWEDSRSGNADVYAIRLDALGAPMPGWPAGGLGVCTAPGAQSQIKLDGDGAGGFFATWRDDRSGGGDIYLQRVTSDGSLASGWPTDGVGVCAAANTQERPALALDGSHGAVVAWADRRAGGYDVYAQRVSGAGSVLWAADGVLLCDAGGNQGAVSVISPGDGSAFVAWRDPRDINTRVYIQRLLATGDAAPGWPANGVWCSPSSIATTNPRMVLGGFGDALVVFDANKGGGTTGVRTDVEASRVRTDGFVATANAIVVTEDYDQTFAAIAEDGAGGSVIVWQDTRNEDPVADVYASRIDADGVLAGGWPPGGRPLCRAAGQQLGLAVAGDGTGGLIATWEDARGTSHDIYAGRVLANGALDPQWPLNGLVICEAFADQSVPAIAATGPDAFVVVWEDARGGAADIYAARFTVNGVVPTTLASVRADATSDAVTLEWHGAPGPGLDAVLERSAAANDWTVLATLSSDGGGRFAYVDRAVSAGAHLGYRLRVGDGRDERVEGGVWVDVPVGPAAALRGAVPNPAAPTQVVAWFTLAGAGPAWLDLLDLPGRIVAHVDVGALGPGSHRVPLRGAEPLHPGLYRLRLASDRGVMHESRVAVLR